MTGGEEPEGAEGEGRDLTFSWDRDYDADVYCVHNDKDDVNVNHVNLENKHLLASEDTIRSCWLLPDPEPGLPSYES